MSLKTKGNRIFYYDFLRAFAIITIIACHVSGGYEFGHIFNQSELPFLYFSAVSFFNHSSQIGVPIFVMLSGALLINRDYSIGEFFKKRFNRVFIPFVFWVLVFIASEILLFNNVDANKLFSIFLASPKSIGHVLWFVWMILIVYCFIFIFNKALSLFDSLNRKRIIDVFVLLFIIFCLLVTFDVFDVMSNRLVYFSSFFGYAIFGYWLANLDLLDSRPSKILRLTPLRVVILSFVIGLGLYLWYASFICLPISIAQNRFAGISIFHALTLVMVFFVFILFKYLDELEYSNVYKKFKEGMVGKLIYSISIHSYGIYFCHYLLIVILSRLMFRSMGVFNKNPLKIIPALTLICLFASWLIVYMMGRIPYLKTLSGKG